jgi:hypothetical protein
VDPPEAKFLRIALKFKVKKYSFEKETEKVSTKN